MSKLTESAHPRSRGEHVTRRCKAGVVIGSSPLARGTLTRSARPLLPARLIPARAGNTTSRRAG